MKQASYLVTLFFVLLLICSVQNAWAQIPQTISYQGVLADAGGAAVPDGNYQLTFKLYDAETGGNELWSEAHNTVAVNNGVFSVILGETTPFNLLFDQQYWLDATIGTDPPLSPRIALTASPYSLNPQGGGSGDGHSLDAADGSPTDALFVDNDGNVGIGTLSPGAELEVAGQLKITGGTPGAGKVLTSDASGLATWENAAGSDNDWTISGNDLFSAVSGNVGIGTTSPQEKLHLNEGELRITTTSDSNLSVSFFDADEEWGEIRSNSSSGADGGLIMSGKRPDGNAALQLHGFIGTDTGVPIFRFLARKYSIDAAEIEGLGGTVPLAPTQPVLAVLNSSASNTLFQILANGNVGIGTTTPGFTLHVNGSAGKPGGGSWSAASDRRLKDIKGQFTRGLDALDHLNPVYYRYKKDNPVHLPSEEEYVGLIAQEVREVIPEAVGDYAEGYLSVNNDPIIWTMLNAIKELHAENAALRAEITEMTSLNARLVLLESMVQKLAATTTVPNQEESTVPGNSDSVAHEE